MARLANSLLPMNLFCVNAQIDDIRPTVKADELPIPLLEGRSPTCVISILLFSPNFFITSLAVG